MKHVEFTPVILLYEDGRLDIVFGDSYAGAWDDAGGKADMIDDDDPVACALCRAFDERVSSGGSLELKLKGLLALHLEGRKPRKPRSFSEMQAELDEVMENHG